MPTKRATYQLVLLVAVSVTLTTRVLTDNCAALTKLPLVYAPSCSVCAVGSLALLSNVLPTRTEAAAPLPALITCHRQTERQTDKDDMVKKEMSSDKGCGAVTSRVLLGATVLMPNRPDLQQTNQC